MWGKPCFTISQGCSPPITSAASFKAVPVLSPPFRFTLSQLSMAKDYQTQADTGATGHYSVNVANGDWNIAVSCQYGDDSLDTILGAGNYQCPNNENLLIANSDA